MWLNSWNNIYYNNNSKNSLNSKQILKWEIEFNEWFKTWNYNWEYYIDEFWEKIEHWNWILNLDGFNWKETYEGKFENWFFIEWTLKKFDDNWEIFTKKWKFKNGKLIEWIIKEKYFIWEWKFEDWYLKDWYYTNLKTWKKFLVTNWKKQGKWIDIVNKENIDNFNNNSNIIDEEINKKISDTLFSLEKVKKNVFESLLRLFDWNSTERTRAINYWLEIIWELKEYFLAIEEFKDKPFELLELLIKIKEKSEELNNIFYKYWFNEYNFIFNDFINTSLNSIESIFKNIKKLYQKNI